MYKSHLKTNTNSPSFSQNPNEISTYGNINGNIQTRNMKKQVSTDTYKQHSLIPEAENTFQNEQ